MTGHNGPNLVWLQQQFPDLQQIVPLSSGGQKQVFAALHRHDGPVVLKLIHPRQDMETTRRELLAVNQLAGARVPRILDSDVLHTPVGPHFWLREQRIEGQTLRERINTRPLGIREVLKLGKQILETLVRAEAVHIVHRDVKPENIILDNAGDSWLIDFGLARHLDLSSLTATAHVFGKYTPGYAPREQFRNLKDDIDHRCDLFAVGVTLYEAAVGTNPFIEGARDVLEVFRRIETRPLPQLNLNFAGQAALCDLVSAMSQRRRDHRPASVQEAFNWMEQICNAEGI